VVEGWIALGLLALLGVLGGALAAPAEALFVAGLSVAVAGLGFGVPTGLVYHVALRRVLLEAGRLPPRWWIQPTALHDEIPPEARPWVLGWCYAGAAGFLVSMLGCALLAIAALRTLA
jgi:hypothetical protein